MLVWGLLLIGAGLITQYVTLPFVGKPYPDSFLIVWISISVIGLVFQGLCQAKYQPLNFWVWVGAVVLGWLFTLYVIYSNPSLYPEIAPVWFVLMALAYVHTAMKIDTKFYWLAAFNFALAIVFEAAWRHWGGTSFLDFLIYYATPYFGLLSGIGLVIGAFFARSPIRRKRPA
jgi:hypothetical protein